ncbi:MAG: hypothetical protein GWP91_06540 [Rhodobacterales bacterium]|nr:hypothetical protein [Rhodobacterales bacterium]
MTYQAFAAPVAQSPVDVRVSYLRKVAGLTFLGVSTSGLVAALAAFVISLVPALQSQMAQLVIILGSFGIAQYGARSLVFSNSAPSRYLGFAVGSVFQGIAMGYLVLTALLMGAELFGSPFMLLFQAMGMVSLTAMGMLMYIMTGPREFSMVKGALSAMSLPMLGLMALSFIFPIGGTFGILISMAFVAFSAGAVMYQLNTVIHEMSSEMHVEGAYTVTMGLLVLFWNLLTLLMKLQRR